MHIYISKIFIPYLFIFENLKFICVYMRVCWLNLKYWIKNSFFCSKYNMLRNASRKKNSLRMNTEEYYPVMVLSIILLT